MAVVVFLPVRYLFGLCTLGLCDIKVHLSTGV
jgi:hypothetical protein